MIQVVEDLLRSDRRFALRGDKAPLILLALCVAIGGAIYGATMGAHGVITAHGARPLQALYSAIKVPLLLGVTTFLCLPSFFVLNTLLGLRRDFRRALQAIVSGQAVMGVTLGALAPVTIVAYLAIGEYVNATMFNGVQFAIGAYTAQVLVGRHYGELVRSNPRHRIARRAWGILYVLIAIQAAWVLRPFVGAPGLETGFFREDAWTNAYVLIGERVLDLLR